MPIFSGLHVSGNKILNVGGEVVTLRGVNGGYGSHFACLSAPIIDPVFGAVPYSTKALQLMKSWGCNVVRVAIAGDCWANIGSPVTFGTPYQSAIIAFVQNILAQGMYAIVTTVGEDHTNDNLSNGPTANTVTFWQQWMSLFGDDPRVILDVFNEPFGGGGMTWSVLYAGGTVDSWSCVGINALLSALRTAGCSSILMTPGLSFTGDLSSWIANQTDANVAASVHWYSDNPPTDVNSIGGRQLYKTIAATYPVIIGECGGVSKDIAPTWLDTMCRFADSCGLHYLPWAWTPGVNISLLSDDFAIAQGRPSVYGIAYYWHLRRVAAGGTVGAGNTRNPVLPTLPF